MKLELAENAANTRRAGVPAGAAMTLQPGAGGDLSPLPQLLYIHVLRETQTYPALSFPLQGLLVPSVQQTALCWIQVLRGQVCKLG